MAKARKLIALKNFHRQGEEAKGYNIDEGQEIPEGHELYDHADLMIYRQQAEWRMVDKPEEKK